MIARERTSKLQTAPVVVYLTCYALFLASNVSAQRNTPPAPQGQVGAIGYSSHSPCTATNSKPDCQPVARLVSAPPATYSDEARKAKIEGSVVLTLTVDEKGNPTDLRVINSLGMGLDKKATDAVRAWKFDPAFGKDGKPVAVKIVAEVPFHL